MFTGLSKSVWYGCDVGQFLNRSTCRMDKANVSHLELLGLSFELNKEQRLNYRDSLMTHAMVITGAKSEEDSRNAAKHYAKAIQKVLKQCRNRFHGIKCLVCGL